MIRVTDESAECDSPPATRWQLHHAVPSVGGWKSLAGMRSTKPVLEPQIFDGRVDVAVDTLKQAIGETVDERTRAVLRRWLYEVSGTTT